ILQKKSSVVALATLLSLITLTSVAADSSGLVPLNLKLPAEAFKGTPKDIQTNTYTEPYPDKPRPAMMVPTGLQNLTKGAKITSSDKNATEEMLGKIIDGD